MKTRRWKKSGHKTHRGGRKTRRIYRKRMKGGDGRNLGSSKSPLYRSSTGAIKHAAAPRDYYGARTRNYKTHNASAIVQQLLSSAPLDTHTWPESSYEDGEFST